MSADDAVDGSFTWVSRQAKRKPSRLQGPQAESNSTEQIEQKA